MTTYSTIQGDTWDWIAYKLYGRESLMLQLMQANPNYIDVVIFSAGAVLSIPAVAPAVSTSLPPWKRGATS
jgi:phage tail protein X